LSRYKTSTFHLIELLLLQYSNLFLSTLAVPVLRSLPAVVYLHLLGPLISHQKHVLEPMYGTVTGIPFPHLLGENISSTREDLARYIDMLL
jgi:hypothetical protein